jgi:hypothetical protein
MALIEDMEPTELTDLPTGVDPDDEQPDLTCDICMRVMNSPRGLKRHRTVAHGLGTANDGEPKRPGGKRGSTLERDLKATLDGVATALLFINPTDGQIIARRSDQLASAWARLANKNPGVRRVLVALTTGSAYGEVVIASLLVVIPILANHKLIPENYVGLADLGNDEDNGKGFLD